MPEPTLPPGYPLFTGEVKSASQIELSATSTKVELGGVELIQNVASEWRLLCDEAPSSEPFSRPDWIEAYIQSFVPQARILLISAWKEGRLRGILPLVQEQGMFSGLPVRKLISCANVHSCRFDLVRCPGPDGDQAVRAIWDGLSQLQIWDVLQMSLVPEGSGLDELLRVAADDGFQVARKPDFESLYFRLESEAGESEPGMAETSRKFRANLRRTRRQLEKLGRVTLQHVEDADPEALQRFFTLESSGWKGQAGTAIALQPQTRLYYELIANAAARDGCFAFDFLELNGQAIAGHFGLFRDGRYMVPKAAYDESFSRFGVGHLIVSNILREYYPRGLREFDFVGPATWDESRWASKRRSHFNLFVFSRGLYGTLLHFARISGRKALKDMLGISSRKKELSNCNQEQ